DVDAGSQLGIEAGEPQVERVVRRAGFAGEVLAVHRARHRTAAAFGNYRAQDRVHDVRGTFVDDARRRRQWFEIGRSTAIEGRHRCRGIAAVLADDRRPRAVHLTVVEIDDTLDQVRLYLVTAVREHRV